MTEKPSKPPEFIPEEWARKGCRNCDGTGTFRVHARDPVQKRVIPRNNNLIVKPCGCATKRYLNAMSGRTMTWKR